MVTHLLGRPQWHVLVHTDIFFKSKSSGPRVHGKTHTPLPAGLEAARAEGPSPAEDSTPGTGTRAHRAEASTGRYSLSLDSLMYTSM